MGGGPPTVLVCGGTNHPTFYTDECWVEFAAFNWIDLGCAECEGCEGNGEDRVPLPPRAGRSIELLARVQYLQPLLAYTVSWRRAPDDR